MRIGNLAMVIVGALAPWLAPPPLLPGAEAAPRPREVSVPLWPQGAPGSEGKTGTEVVVETDGVRRIHGIHNPSVTVYLPPRRKATGAAVIIMPGGGHRYLAID